MPDDQLLDPGNSVATDLPERVNAAHQRMLKRQGTANALLSNDSAEAQCQLGQSEQQLLHNAIRRLGVSTRGYFRTLKVARTIADLEDTATVRREHLMEALGYRPAGRPA